MWLHYIWYRIKLGPKLIRSLHLLYPPPPLQTPRVARDGLPGGRKQVNKALHTCTSWYAYAAMFGSSIDTMVPQALERMYRLH